MAEMKVFWGLVPFGVPERKTISCCSCSFQWLPTTLGIPWFANTSLQFLHSSSDGTFSVSLCDLICFSVSNTDTVFGLRAHPNLM